MKVISISKLIFLFIISAYSSASHSTETGEFAPNFELITLDGEKTMSLSSYQGKVVYLDFWASWCPPCLVSIPMYAKWSESLNPKESVIITINLDQNPKKAKAFLNRHPVNYLVLSDPQGISAKEFGLPAMPTSYIINRNGKIVYRHSGFRRRDLERIKEEFAKALSDQENE